MHSKIEQRVRKNLELQYPYYEEYEPEYGLQIRIWLRENLTLDQYKLMYPINNKFGVRFKLKDDLLRFKLSFIK